MPRTTLSQRLLVIWTVMVLAFLYLPIVRIIVFSFNQSTQNVVREGFTWRWYGQVWRDAPLMTALWNSVVIAMATTLIASVLGTIAGWLLHHYRFRAAKRVQGLIFFPMVVPEIIDSLCIPHGAAHKEAAEQFINYILRPEVSKLISDKFPYTNPNAAARKLLSREQLDNPASYPQAGHLEAFHDIGPATQQISAMMTELRGG